MILSKRAKEIKAELLALIKKPKAPSDLERRVLELFDAEISVDSVPLRGLTTVEVTQLIPGVDKATVRWVMWDLRKRGILKECGVTRALKKGQRASPAFVKVINVDIS